MKPKSLLTNCRKRFHEQLLNGPLTMSNGVPAIADKDNKRSVRLAQTIIAAMGGARTVTAKQAGQTAGGQFERCVAAFVTESFLSLSHLRPGKWKVIATPGHISQFEQYQHLAELLELVKAHPKTKSALGGDYLIKPDLIIARVPEPDEILNTTPFDVVDDHFPQHSPLRAKNNDRLILHASISCKWTIRSDRSQNTRTEALNLMRNRKGSVPHAVAVTAEPLPSRIGSIAYGTGDLDCVYHVALPELMSACTEEDDSEELNVLVQGRRLRDIADLPLDLAL